MARAPSLLLSKFKGCTRSGALTAERPQWVESRRSRMAAMGGKGTIDKTQADRDHENDHFDGVTSE